MAYLEFPKNRSETIRVRAERYLGDDYIDIRIFYRNREGIVSPTKRGIKINIDQVSTLLEAIYWALQQPCNDDPDAQESPMLTHEELEPLAAELHWALSQHGIAVHWDIAESMVFSNPAMSQFNKWQMHFVLTTRHDLFAREDIGCFRAITQRR